MNSAEKDLIEFRLTSYCYGPDIFPTLTVEIYINGENFRDKVRDVERPFAEAEGNPGIAGHATITPRELYESLHNDYLEFDSVSIFGCSCGVIDCWPLDVVVDVGTKTVTWYGFNMYHREKWDYADLGKIVFDKQQYFREVDKLLIFEKQGLDIYKNFQVAFEPQKYGWIKMYMSLEGTRCVANLSYLFSPFDGLLNLLKGLESGSSYEEVKIDEEGSCTNIKIEATETNDILNVMVIQENADDTPGKYYSCRSSRENFIQAFKMAFRILEDEGFDPNFWDEHEPDYIYDDEDDVNPRDVMESFWSDPWFQFLREP